MAVPATASAMVLALGLTACATGETPTGGRDRRSDAAATQPVGRPSPPPTPDLTPEPTPAQREKAPAPDKPTMQRATMSIPDLGVRGLPVVPYRGSPDDGPGTLIQNRGVAASPFGDRGGVGPGQVGNYIVTAHRTTGGTPPFATLPSLGRDAHVLITTRRWVFDYRVTGTRWTSFRKEQSLARQSAAVPGHPGRTATQARITLSTCATQEDHAAGNYWSDEFGNPEHRIDKIGLLVDARPVRQEASKEGGDRA